MSYSSCGRADGGSVARLTPLGLTLRGGGTPGGGATGAAGGAATALRSSGAPASRPFGAPITGSAEATAPGGAAICTSPPSVRGAPGAFGLALGSKTSERWRGGGKAVGEPMVGEPVGGAAAAGGTGLPLLAPSCWSCISIVWFWCC